MPIKIRELDEKTGKPKKKMPLPKPKPRHANPKHPMNTERTGPLRKAKGGKLEMVEKGGKKVPFFAADGVGKMAKGGSMKIKSGDTLSQIAKKNNISLRDLLSANPSIKNANKIRVGQSIKLPSTKMTGSSIGATRNPYKNMSKTDMADMDVKNKSAKRQQAVTKRSRVSAMDELKAKAKAPKPRTKQGGETVKSTMKKAGKTVMSAAKSGFLGPRAQGAAEIVNNAPKAAKAAKSLRLRRGKPPQTPSMSGLRDDDVAAYKGGAMKKKVQGYKSGGMCRGGGAATKGRRYGRSG
jgi:LysM repeat protein